MMLDSAGESISSTPVEEILIVGAGVFGLSTALSLLSRPAYSNSHITIVDASPTLPNPSGSSVDASRIVRADYACRPYAELGIAAQKLWRDTSDDGWGGEGRYHEPGLVLTAEEEKAWYVTEALQNVQGLAKQGVDGIDLEKIEIVDGEDAIRKATGYTGKMGRSGYANWNSGWADAEASVAFAIRQLQKKGGKRVTVRSGCQIERLLYDGRHCAGAELVGGEKLIADLVVLAAGAWTPSLIDLEGRCLATGHVLTYINITEEEQERMQYRPTIFNMTSGMFVIPPRGGELKIARHGFGYRNMRKVSHNTMAVNGESQESRPSPREISIPTVGLPVPHEGQEACRQALRDIVPEVADRPFVRTRICWYCDTPDGDFLIDYHPEHPNLFLATGGSGHGFKFFPIIGEKIADAVEGKLDSELKRMWRWREERCENFTNCMDGSRAGPQGMILDEEMRKGGKQGVDSDKT